MSLQGFEPRRSKPGFGTQFSASFCQTPNGRAQNGQWMQSLVLKGARESNSAPNCALCVDKGDVCVRQGAIYAQGGITIGNNDATNSDCKQSSAKVTLQEGATFAGDCVSSQVPNSFPNCVPNNCIYAFNDWQPYQLSVVAQDTSTVHLQRVFHARFKRLNQSVTLDINCNVSLSPEHNRMSFALTLPDCFANVNRSSRSTILLESREPDARSAEYRLVPALLLVAPLSDGVDNGAVLQVFTVALQAGQWNVAGQIMYEAQCAP